MRSSIVSLFHLIEKRALKQELITNKEGGSS